MLAIWVIGMAVSLADTGVASCPTPPVAVAMNPWDGATTSFTPVALTMSTDTCATSANYLLTRDGLPVEEGADVEIVGSTATWTPTTPLADLTTWCWTVRALDVNGASGGDTSRSCFTVDTENQAPGAPSWVTPRAGAVILSTQRFTLAPAVDPEHRALRYEIEVVGEAGTVGQGHDLRESELTDRVLTGLVEDTWYLARARATDWGSLGPWATTAFFVNDDNRAPNAPLLDEAQVDLTLGRVTFSAHGAVDPEGFPVRYTVELRDATGAAVMSWSELRPDPQGLVTVMTRAITPGSYQWTARAIDYQGMPGLWAGSQAVHVPSPEDLPSGRPVPDDGLGGLEQVGCGCDTPGAPSVAWVGLLALAVRRRR